MGKILTPTDYNVLLTRDCRVLKPTGQPLCVFVKGAVPEGVLADAYPLLSSIRNVTNNRGLAAGAPRVKLRNQNYARPVMSSVLGYFEPSGGARFPYARQTAWTQQHPEGFRALYPYFEAVAEVFAAELPARYRVQQAVADRTDAAYIIPGTPYSTITVNNTYATGVHQDAGDLKEGFSCMGVLRRGEYAGGQFVLPEYRVAVELGEGDVILMDPHEWHGNVQIVPASPDAERISVVCYYRTKLAACQPPAEELARAKGRQRLTGVAS